jgi:hypothetical protein
VERRDLAGAAHEGQELPQQLVVAHAEEP